VPATERDGVQVGEEKLEGPGKMKLHPWGGELPVRVSWKKTLPVGLKSGAEVRKVKQQAVEHFS